MSASKMSYLVIRSNVLFPVNHQLVKNNLSKQMHNWSRVVNSFVQVALNRQIQHNTVFALAIHSFNKQFCQNYQVSARKGLASFLNSFVYVGTHFAFAVVLFSSFRYVSYFSCLFVYVIEISLEFLNVYDFVSFLLFFFLHISRSPLSSIFILLPFRFVVLCTQTRLL